MPRTVQVSRQKRTSRMQYGVQRYWYAGAWRTKEGVARKRKQDAHRKRERWAADPSIRAAKRIYRKNLSDRRTPEERERHREGARRNHEKHKHHRNKKRVEWGRKNKSRQLDNQRAWYARNKERYTAEERARRDRRNPARVIRRLSQELKSGGVNIHSVVAQIKQQIDAFDGRVRTRLRPRQVSRRHTKSRITPDTNGN